MMNQYLRGIVQLWDGVAEALKIAGKNIFDIKFLAAKTIKKLQDQTCKKYKIRRLQTSVKADFDRGLRFATWCGFEIEGLKSTDQMVPTIIKWGVYINELVGNVVAAVGAISIAKFNKKVAR